MVISVADIYKLLLYTRYDIFKALFSLIIVYNRTRIEAVPNINTYLTFAVMEMFESLSEE